MSLFVSVCSLFASRPRNNEQLRGQIKIKKEIKKKGREQGSKAAGCEQRREEGLCCATSLNDFSYVCEKSGNEPLQWRKSKFRMLHCYR